MQVYSTSSRRKTDLNTREPGRVGIYVCGPTVYDEPHLGHARSAIAFDVIRRYLVWRGLEVTFISNFTDVDDRIIKRANDEGISSAEVAERYIAIWNDYMGRLGVEQPDVSPRATEHIPEMIELIESLIDGGRAYESGGDVYFSISSFPRYGELSGRKVEDLEAGARVEPGEEKRDPLDFALWKAAKPNEPSWESPWGLGRPGWHIECSAMSLKYLGEGFDIHGGGQDLIFPHHENEKAQSEALDRPFARLWMHNGLVNLEGEKMSKSTGLFISLSDVLSENDPEVVRLIALQSHYRKPLDFGRSEVEQASSALERLREFDRRARHYADSGRADADASANAGADSSGADAATPAGAESGGADTGASAETEATATFRSQFVEAMDDDFNTPEALGAIFDLVRVGNHAIDSRAPRERLDRLLAEFEELCGVLGISVANASSAPVGAAATLVDLVLELRESARAERDWEMADRLRDALAEMGVVVEDSSTGPEWHWRSGRG